MDSTELFYFLPNRKKSGKKNKICQNHAVGKFTQKKERKWRLNYFSSMSNYGQKILIPKIAIPPSANSKIKVSEKLYITQKIPHKCFETYGQDWFWPISVCCSKSYSGVLVFGIFTAISAAPKEQSWCRPVNFYKLGQISKLGPNLSLVRIFVKANLLERIISWLEFGSSWF